MRCARDGRGGYTCLLEIFLRHCFLLIKGRCPIVRRGQIPMARERVALRRASGGRQRWRARAVECEEPPTYQLVLEELLRALSQPAELSLLITHLPFELRPADLGQRAPWKSSPYGRRRASSLPTPAPTCELGRACASRPRGLPGSARRECTPVERRRRRPRCAADHACHQHTTDTTARLALKTEP